MTPQLFNYIRHLSTQDRKTLSQRALKTCEEVGELAKVVLPFDNAYATTHRFTERESILEEAVDTILCSLSVAYGLNFTDDDIEEMFVRKSEKWALLQSKEQDVTYPIPYEIHVTVRCEQSDSMSLEDKLSQFKDICATINVKPIVLDLLGKNGSVKMVDVMTSSKHFGTNASAYEEVRRISAGLVGFFTVVRKKIETVPWHPAAPVGNQPMPPNCYFESHVPVTLAASRVEELREAVAALNNPHLHVSRNTLKKHEDGTIVQMITMRLNVGTFLQFKERLDAMISALSSCWDLGKVITEFSIYDTKVSHDTSWIKG